MENKQQKLREWILTQKYFALTPEFDGMTAWELAGIIIKELEGIENKIIGDDMAKKEPECEQGHICTSGCQKDFDCPCLADHCCSMTPKEDLCGELDSCEYCNTNWKNSHD